MTFRGTKMIQSTIQRLKRIPTRFVSNLFRFRKTKRNSQEEEKDVTSCVKAGDEQVVQHSTFSLLMLPPLISLSLSLCLSLYISLYFFFLLCLSVCLSWTYTQPLSLHTFLIPTYVNILFLFTNYSRYLLTLFLSHKTEWLFIKCITHSLSPY